MYTVAVDFYYVVMGKREIYYDMGVSLNLYN